MTRRLTRSNTTIHDVTTFSGSRFDATIKSVTNERCEKGNLNLVEETNKWQAFQKSYGAGCHKYSPKTITSMYIDIHRVLDIHKGTMRPTDSYIAAVHECCEEVFGSDFFCEYVMNTSLELLKSNPDAFKHSLYKIYYE
jgi:hypothetical protein